MSTAFYVAELRSAMAGTEPNWPRVWALVIMWPTSNAEPDRAWALRYIASEATRRDVVGAMLKTWRAHMVDRMAGIDAAEPSAAGSVAFEIDNGMMFIETQLSSQGHSNSSDQFSLGMKFTGLEQNPSVIVQRSAGAAVEFEGVSGLQITARGRMEQLALATALELAAHHLREKWRFQEPASDLFFTSDWEAHLATAEQAAAPPEPDDEDE